MVTCETSDTQMAGLLTDVDTAAWDKVDVRILDESMDNETSTTTIVMKVNNDNNIGIEPMYVSQEQ
jgi:hypothetical protein